MTSETILFASVFGPALFAVFIGMAADGFGDGERGYGSFAAVCLLALGGIAGFYLTWTIEPLHVFDLFVIGGAHSGVTATIALLGAAVIVAVRSTHPSLAGSVAALISLSVLGAGLAASSADLVVILLTLETVALCAYALASTARTARSAESAFRYFVLGALATGFFVTGSAVLIPLSGSTGGFEHVSESLQALRQSDPGMIATLLIVAALALKAGAAPLHWWAPDVYETAPPPVAGFLAGAMKLGVVAVLGGFVTFAIPRDPLHLFSRTSMAGEVLVVLAALSVISIVVGSLGALRQRSFTRMLGYAGIAQVGYALIALVALSPSAAVVLLITYSVAVTAAFVAAAEVQRTLPDWDGSIAGMAGLGRRNALLGTALAVSLFSQAGIPPLMGFWGKFQAFGAALSTAWALWAQDADRAVWIYAALLVAGIVGTVVSLWYYGAVVRSVFFDRAGPEAAPESQPVPGSVTWLVVLLAVVIVVLGVAPLVFGIVPVFSVFAFAF